MNMKKIMSAAVAGVLCAGMFTGCSSDSSTAEQSSSDFKASSDITVISREDGSGTRGAFIELFGVEQKNDAGEKVDYTVESASVTQSTGVMMTSVFQNEYAIGYISLGSLNDTVKSVDIDGVEATVYNIKSGDYKIARPFNIATGANLSDVAADFIDFIMSADGQAVIADPPSAKLAHGSSF